MTLGNGQITIGSSIAEGGHCTIFEVVDNFTGRKCVAKVPGGAACDIATARALLEAEIKAYRLIGGHENLLDVLGVLEEPWADSSLLVLVLQYAAFGSLRDWLNRYRSEHQHRLRCGKDLFRQICRGVSHMNRRGFAHGDLKPENLLFLEPETIALSDLGCACPLQGFSLARPLGEAHFIAGTPEYISPELLYRRIASPTARSDVYSIGCTAHEIFSRDAIRPSQRFREPWRNVNAILHSLLVEGVPERIATVISSCLEEPR